jgi:aminoglycoside phosphotransferase (APT) family kinase protein
MKRIHPATKPCTKCSGLMQWERQHVGQPSMNLIYVCRECSFIGEMWKYHS